ncbi:hypothetical protein C0993_001641 [Termitomyces sp. T159_Od127]|nr:hypothetical protein C0993_001641 [Termitomyces sp. T159_Od127]
MARYHNNLGTEWVALFANNFMPAAPSFDKELEALVVGEEPLVVSTAAKGKEAVIAPLVEQDLRWQEEFWQEVAKESEADMQQRSTSSLEALACEGLGLGEATEAGERSQQGQEEEEEEGAKEKTPNTMAGAAMGAARKAPTGGAKGLALPAKKESPTKLASKHRGRPAPRYKCDKCWMDNHLVGASPCFRCVAMKRLCTFNGTKTQECSNAPDSTVEKTYHQAVLVRRAQVVVEKAREAEAQGEAVSLSKKSLALPTCQEDEERGSGKRKRKASLPLLPTDKGKKRVRVVSPAVVTPEVESEENDEDEACCLSTAIEASKAVPGVEDLAGPSHQAEVPQDIGALPEEMEWDQAEEEAKVGPEATPQAQPWGWGLPQWSWLLEWGANDPTTQDVSSGDELKS